MKFAPACISVAASLFLSGCYSVPVYLEAPVPRESVGGVQDEAGWRPYTAPQPERRAGGEWTPQNREWGARPAPVEPTVKRAELPPAKPNHVADSRDPVSVHAERGETTSSRALPKDPPSDLSRRRSYSSRPDRNAELNKGVGERNDSAFGRGASQAGNREKVRRAIRSEWADKAVRGDNRPGFDKMVVDSSRRGKGTFEDEAGRVYYGERRGNEDGCTVVEVTVTTNGGLPVVARGLAYDCP